MASSDWCMRNGAVHVPLDVDRTKLKPFEVPGPTSL